MKTNFIKEMNTLTYTSELIKMVYSIFWEILNDMYPDFLVLIISYLLP